MRREIKEFFENQKIEYYAAQDYSALVEINRSLILRSGIEPRSAIIFLLPYFTGIPENISAYSASKDYHIAVREITERLISLLEQLYPDNKFAGFGDHSPINERHAAAISGLGILGDNGLIINEKYGTYVFLAEVITDVPPELVGCTIPVPVQSCEGCGACKIACPTGILRKEGDECLSYITQKKGTLAEDEINLMKKYNTVWGCDICQRVCPHNVSPRITPIEFFHSDRIDKLDTKLLDSMSDEEFKRRAFAWRGRKTVIRNLEYFEL